MKSQGLFREDMINFLTSSTAAGLKEARLFTCGVSICTGFVLKLLENESHKDLIET